MGFERADRGGISGVARRASGRTAKATLLSAAIALAGIASWAGCAAAPSNEQVNQGSGGATTSGSSSSSSSSGSPCPGANLCGTTCTNITFDPSNCGACGTKCAAGQVCSGGKCGLTCSGGSTQCNDKCVDIVTDPANCGSCAHACAGSDLCSASQCSQVCLGGTVNCSNKCVDTTEDAANCGACGTACKAGEVCSAGQCGLSCVGGSTKCGAKCVDTSGDPANCGACGTACPAGQVCAGGACGLLCLGGTSKCGAICVDKTNDPTNCGACGTACAPGQSCVNGVCGFCQPGFTQCNGTCVDEKQDPKNCGGCGVVCPANQVCSQGVCASFCAGSLTECGKNCLDTSTDVKNCGACGNVCAAGAKCAAGACKQCDSATTDCDGDGWTVSEGDCCDKPGLCGSEPAKVNPGAIEVVGNGVDDNCNGLTDLFDTQDTVPCDNGLASDSTDPGDYAKAIGICRLTRSTRRSSRTRPGASSAPRSCAPTASPLGDFEALSIRPGFGSIAPATTQGTSMMVISSGIASDATQTMPGPNIGAPGGFNVSTNHMPASAVNLGVAGRRLRARLVRGAQPAAQARQRPAELAGLPLRSARRRRTTR